MITISQAVDLAAKIYDPLPGDFDQIISAGGIVAGLSKVGDTLAVTFRGTDNVMDAFRDVLALPYHHPKFGPVHAGFWYGMGDFWVMIRPYLKGKISITCHSLGCPRGAYLAALCAMDNIAVDQLIMFAPPRPGYAAIRDIVLKHVPDIQAYRNGPDPVPMLAETLPGLPWCDIAELKSLNSAPEGWLDDHNPLCWHHIALYKAGIKTI